MQRITAEQAFGQRLKEVRNSAGLSQAELARKLEEESAAAGVPIALDPTAITRIERGSRSVRLNEAVALAQVLGETVDRMLRMPLPLNMQLEEARREEQHAEIRRLRAVTEFNDARQRRLELEERIAEQGEKKETDDGEREAPG